MSLNNNNYDILMQQDKSKNLQLSQKLGKVIKKLRQEKTALSVNKLADGYDIARGNLSKIENGQVECKFVTAWRIAEAIGVKPSYLVKILEKELGDDFKLIDE